MEPSEIRSELLDDHKGVRERMARAAALVAGLRAGEAPREALHDALGALADATLAHNAHEEELLKEVIPTVDAWGPARADVMYEQHRLEHQALHAAILRARETPDVEALCAEVDVLLAGLAKHMTREEEAFLGEDVLRDDNLLLNYFGG